MGNAVWSWDDLYTPPRRGRPPGTKNKPNHRAGRRPLNKDAEQCTQKTKKRA
jgi:hypothetical protein